MDKVESPENVATEVTNVAEVLETRLSVSSGVESSSLTAGSHHDELIIDVDADFPHLNALKDDLYVLHSQHA